MRRDDVSLLFDSLGLTSLSYVDFQTKDDLLSCVGRILAKRAELGASNGVSSPVRKRKVVAVISEGAIDAGRLVDGLAKAASQRLKGAVPVSVVDLAPVRQQAVSGVRHVLINTISPVSRIAAAEDVAWLDREIAEASDEGLVFVDVPERVLHVRRNAIAAADMLLVLIPAVDGVARAVEEIELEMEEMFSSEWNSRAHYVLVEPAAGKGLAPAMQQELIAHKELFVPVCLRREAIADASEASAWTDVAGHRDLVEICNFIFGGLPK